MNSSEINRASGRIFTYLLPPSWAARVQEDHDDYGIDYEIEPITAGEKPTGAIFKIQLKGIENAHYTTGDVLVYSKASVEKFAYYYQRLRIPLIFFVCDLARNECRFQSVHGNEVIEKAFLCAAANEQKTFTITFPPETKFRRSEVSATALLALVEEANANVTLRHLPHIPPDVLRKHVTGRADLKATNEQMRLLLGIVADEQIRQTAQAGDLDAACHSAQMVLESETEAPVGRLLAGIQYVSLRTRILIEGGTPTARTQALDDRLTVSRSLLRIARSSSCPSSAKLFIRIYARAARLQKNGSTALHLAISEKAQTQQGDDSVVYLTRVQRAQVSHLVIRDFLMLQNAMHRLGCAEHYYVMPFALVEVTEAILPYLMSFDISGADVLVPGFVNALLEWLPFCVSVISTMPPDDQRNTLFALGVRFAFLAAATDSTASSKTDARFDEAVATLPRTALIAGVLTELAGKRADIAARFKDDRAPDASELRSYFIQQATALGIDLNDQTCDLARVVRHGIEDLDPSRVLANCVEIHVMVTAKTVPGLMLGLPTAGPKRVSCLKYGHSVEAQSLDAAYSTFFRLNMEDGKSICCANCPVRRPHPTGWIPSDSWMLEQHARYEDLINRRPTSKSTVAR